MEAERSNRNSRSVKRKPLSDRTNIIPTSTIHNLSSPPRFTKSSNPNSVPVQIPKPFNSSSKPRKQSSNSSKSQSSVGSSNHYNNNSSTKDDQNNTRVPQPHPSTPPTNPLLQSQSTNPGSGNGEIIEPLVGYKRRQTADKTGSQGKAVAVPLFSYSPLEKPNNDKGKVDSVAFTSPSVEKMKDKGKAIAVPSNIPNVGLTEDKGKAIAVPSNIPNVGLTKDKGKAIALPSNIPNVGLTKDKGKAIALPLDISAVMKTKDKGKAIAVPFSVPTFGKTQDKRKAIEVPFDFPSLEKISNRKVVDKTLSSHSLDKAKRVAMPLDYPTLGKPNDRGRGFSAAFSSSPLPGPKSIWNEPDEAGDVGLPKFQTDPHLKHKKKRCTNDASKHKLPREFIEQQRAYFKEIDEFELPVEEASDDE